MADDVYSDEELAIEDIQKPADLFLKLRRWFREDKDHWSDWRRDAKEDFAFAAGDQWETSDKAFLEEQGRPLVTFNRIGPIIDSVAGLEVANRQEVRYLPREVGDAGVNEVLTGAGEWARDQCDAEDEESDAFQDACICGVGATETRPDYMENPEGKIIVDRLDPLMCLVDQGSTKRNFADRGHHFYVKKMSRDAAKDMFPKADPHKLHATWANLEFDMDEPHDATPERAYNQGDQGDGDRQPDEVNIVFAEWWEPEEFYRLLIEMQGQEPVRKDVETKAEADAMQTRVEQMAAMGMPASIKVVPGKRRKYMQAFLGAEVLESGPGRCSYGFSINFMTGKRDRNEGTFYGLIRVMKDPQRWSNKFFSTALHDLNTGGKGIIAEATAFENWREAEEGWTQYDKIVKAAPGAVAGGKIMPKPAPTALPQIAKLMEFAINSIRDTSGVNLELLGMADRNQPGVLEYQRKQAGMTILAVLFDSLRRYRKIQGRVMLHLIQEYISDGRLIRITGTEGSKYVPLVREEGLAEYDVIVDEANTSPNMKERTWAIISQMMPTIQALGMPPAMWAEVLRYSPLPAAMVDKIAKMLMEGEQQQVPEQVQKYIEGLTEEMKKVQGELQKTQQQNLELKMNREADMLSAQTQAALKAKELEIKREEADLKARIDVLQLQIKGAESAQKMFIEQSKAERDEKTSEQQIGMDRERWSLERGANEDVIREELGTELKGNNEIIVETVQTLVDLVQVVAGAAENIKEAAEAMTKPKRIVRDPKTGRATGVETVH